jgi:hypothetical protein
VAHWDDEDRDGNDLEPQLPVEQELVGSVYMVPDHLWKFRTPGREDHPGVCVWVDLKTRLAFLYKGTDLSAARADRTELILVEPSEENGLNKPTALSLDPHCIRLHILLNLHRSPRWLGRLEVAALFPLRQHFEALLRLFPGVGSSSPTGRV